MRLDCTWRSWMRRKVCRVCSVVDCRMCFRPAAGGRGSARGQHGSRGGVGMLVCPSLRVLTVCHFILELQRG